MQNQLKAREKNVLNQTFNLIRTKAFEKALKLIEDFLDEGGKKSPGIVANLSYLYNAFKTPDKSKLDVYVAEVSSYLRENQEYQITAVMENFLSLTSSKGYARETMELFEFLLRAAAPITVFCWINYTYAAGLLDDESKDRVSALVDSRMPKEERYFGEFPMIFGNTASLLALRGKHDRALHYLRLCKKWDYDNFNSLRNSKDFKSMTGLDEFQRLFE
ncbi:MAG: hypothetical protein JW904_13590 [Spirochaetales bacterium]|nr:hypothetical protein [Spirochaetales bacterium]